MKISAYIVKKLCHHLTKREILVVMYIIEVFLNGLL